MHVDRDLEGVIAAPEDQTAQRTHIAVVAAPGQRDVIARRHDIVCGVHIYPADPGAISRNPGVRNVRAGKPRAAGRRIRSKIAADVARGQLERAQAGDLEVSEILAHAAAFAKDFLGRGAHISGAGIEAEIRMNAAGQIEQSFEKGSSRRK